MMVVVVFCRSFMSLCVKAKFSLKPFFLVLVSFKIFYWSLSVFKADEGDVFVSVVLLWILGFYDEVIFKGELLLN